MQILLETLDKAISREYNKGSSKASVAQCKLLTSQAFNKAQHLLDINRKEEKIMTTTMTTGKISPRTSARVSDNVFVASIVLLRYIKVNIDNVPFTLFKESVWRAIKLLALIKNVKTTTVLDKLTRQLGLNFEVYCCILARHIKERHTKKNKEWTELQCLLAEHASAHAYFSDEVAAIARI